MKEVRTYKKKFEGTVKKILKQKATIEFERLVYVPKYERFAKDKTRIHAIIPENLISQIKVGQIVEITKCRPLCKTIHHVMTKIKTKENIKK